MSPAPPSMASTLPLSFEIAPKATNSHPLNITVLQPISNVKLHHVPLPLVSLDTSRNTTVTSSQRIFRLSESLHHSLQVCGSLYFFVKVQKSVSDKDHALGLIFNIHGHFYCLADLDSDSKFKNIIEPSELPGHIRQSQDLIPRIQKVVSSPKLTPDQLAAIDSFSMKPPDTPPTVNSPSLEDSPLEFLLSRYFTILYSLTTPLNYFPKTALTRLANLCANDNTSIANTLAKLVWSIDKMDNRHQKKFELVELMGTKEISGSSERSAQLDFISKNHAVLAEYVTVLARRKNESESTLSTKELSSEEMGQKLFLELKIREAQLQVLVIFELLRVWNISEETYLESCLKKQKKEVAKKNKESKQSLVRKKNAKKTRKIMPTFLGMGVNVRDSDKVAVADVKTIDEYSLFSNLDTIVDRMGVWDTLLGRTKGNDSDSAYGFLAYVLVPYYNKKLPVLVKYVIDKIKDSNMKLVTQSFKKFERELQKKSKEGSSPLESGDAEKEKQKETTRPSKFRKTLLHQKMPTLKKSATIDLSEDDNLRPAFSLKRSKSNLSSKHLRKRQVDMSVNNEKSQKDKDSKQSANISTKENDSSFIFTKVKKVKLTTNSKGSGSDATKMSSISQVQATPSKNRIINFNEAQHVQVESPPIKASSRGESNKSFSQIESTPQSNGRVFDFRDIINTPEDRFIKPSNASSTNPHLTEKLLQASSMPAPQGHPNIIESPYKQQETPKESIISSPFASSGRRKKPGEPVSVTESPFFNANLDGSPVYGGIFGTKKKAKESYD